MIFLWTGPRMTFFTIPKPQTGFVRDGQKYLYKGTWLFDEGPSAGKRVLIWESHCADCGELFSVVTGMTNIPAPNRRCDLHKEAGRPATKDAAKRKRKFYSKAKGG